MVNKYDIGDKVLIKKEGKKKFVIVGLSFERLLDDDSGAIIEDLFYLVRNISNKEETYECEEDQIIPIDNRALKNELNNKQIDFLLDEYISLMSIHEIICSVSEEDNEYKDRANLVLEMLRNKGKIKQDVKKSPSK